MQRRRDDRGAALVEFALVLPVLVLFVFGIVEFGRAYNARIELTSAVREGARAAALGGDGVAATKAGAPGPDRQPDHVAYTRPRDALRRPHPTARPTNATVTATYPFQYTIPFFPAARGPSPPRGSCDAAADAGRRPDERGAIVVLMVVFHGHHGGHGRPGGGRRRPARREAAAAERRRRRRPGGGPQLRPRRLQPRPWPRAWPTATPGTASSRSTGDRRPPTRVTVDDQHPRRRRRRSSRTPSARPSPATKGRPCAPRPPPRGRRPGSATALPLAISECDVRRSSGSARSTSRLITFPKTSGRLRRQPRRRTPPAAFGWLHDVACRNTC